MRFLWRLFRGNKVAVRPREGCGYWIFTSIASVLLLCMNVAVVQVAYEALTPLWVEMLGQPRVAQASVIIAPALLIFVEWWMWESLVDWLFRDKRSR